jgi:predicted Zn-dependent protease with MMP-like domain
VPLLRGALDAGRRASAKGVAHHETCAWRSHGDGQARGQEILQVTRKAFEGLVREALDAIPRDFRDRMQNVEIVVEDRASPTLEAEMGDGADEALFGLYQGTPLTERSWAHGNALPDRITLFQRTIEDACDNDDEVFEEVCLTLIHEAGHFFGLSEEEIEAIEDEFWYGGPASDSEPENGPDKLPGGGRR